MYCKKCGANIPKGNNFCEQCGAPITSNKIKGNKLSNKAIIAIVAAIVVLFGGIGAVTATVTSHKNADYNDKVATAQQYLDSGDYETAIETFDAAIAVRPKKAEGYLGKAKAQQSAGNYKEAIATLQTGYEKANDKEEIEKELKSLKTEYEGEWKAAYRKVLEDNRAGIEAYVNAEVLDFDGATALCDLNGDGIPELLFISNPTGDDTMDFALHIYTYKDSTAQEVKFSRSRYIGLAGENGSNIDERSGFGPIIAGGEELGYIVFVQKENNRITFYSKNTGEQSEIHINQYEMSETGEMEEVDYVTRISTMIYNGEGAKELYTHEDSYLEMGKDITEKTYNDRVNGMFDDIEDVVMIGHNANPSLDKQLWEKARKFKPLNKSYEDILKELSTGEPADDSKPKQTKDDKYGEYMDKLLEAYAKDDIATAEQYNNMLPKNAEEMKVSEEESRAYEDLFDGMVQDGVVQQYGDFHFITDIDKDGKSEFMVKTGTCEADFMLQVWQYRNGRCVFLDEVGGGHCGFHEYPGRNGFIIQVGHMGSELIRTVRLENGKLVEKEIGRRGFDGEFVEYFPLNCYMDGYDE